MRASGAMRDASKVWNPSICSRVARLAVVATLPLLAHCSAAPRLDDVQPGHAIPPGNTTMLDRVIDAGLGDEPGLCAVRLIRPPPTGTKSHWSTRGQGTTIHLPSGENVGRAKPTAPAVGERG